MGKYVRFEFGMGHNKHALVTFNRALTAVYVGFAAWLIGVDLCNTSSVLSSKAHYDWWLGSR